MSKAVKPKKLNRREIGMLFSEIKRDAEKCDFYFDESEGSELGKALGAKSASEVCAVTLGDFLICVTHNNETNGLPLGYHPESYRLSIFKEDEIVADSGRVMHPELISLFKYVCSRGKKAKAAKGAKNVVEFSKFLKSLK